MLDFKTGNNWTRSAMVDGKQVKTFAGTLWDSVNKRCDPNQWTQKNEETYLGCENLFRDFNEFSEWCQTQVGYKEGFHLDKDLLEKGNKRYSKDTCIFVPQEINNALTKCNKRRGIYPVGVSPQRKCKSLIATVSCWGKNVYLGSFSDSLSAFNAYKAAKEAYLKALSDKWKDKIDPRSYEALMNYQVEITD